MEDEQFMMKDLEAPKDSYKSPALGTNIMGSTIN